MRKYQKNLMEKTNRIYAVYGAGGCGRGLIPFVRQNYKSKSTKISHKSASKSFCN